MASAEAGQLAEVVSVEDILAAAQVAAEEAKEHFASIRKKLGTLGSTITKLMRFGRMRRKLFRNQAENS